MRKNVKERGVKLKERFAREKMKEKVLVVASKNLKKMTRIRNWPFTFYLKIFKILE